MLETEVDFMELQEQLNQLIIDHDPEEAKKLGLLTGYQSKQSDMGVGTVKQDEEEQGLEAQVTVLVQKLFDQFELQQNKRINEVEEKVIHRLDLETEKMNALMMAKQGQMEREINMVSMAHIQDFTAIKNITKEYVMTKDRLQQKVQMVVDMERQYQLLLHHMRKTSRIVDQLVEINITRNN